MSTWKVRGAAPRESRHIEVPVMKRRELPEGAVIHHLRGGVTPCGMPGMPHSWPATHFWSVDWSEVTCGSCKAVRS